VRSRPAKPFLKNGELSAAGIKWQEYTSAAGLPFESVDSIEVVVGCDDPNPQSPSQIKDWLYAHGWIPTDFKYVREVDGSSRKIPQVNLSEGRVSQSVLDLADKLPAVEYLAGLGVVKHRLGMCKGFMRDMHKGTLKAGCQGLTNTLRLKHRELVNLPSGRALYGSKIRGLLKAREGYTLLGSDLSSLEDRIKHHFQWPLDQQYVEQQLDKEFDPHLLIAVMGGMMTQVDSDWYKDVKAGRVQKDEVRFKVLDKVRSKAKQINYAAQYGAGVETMARAAGVTKAVATDLRDAYKRLNWSIDKIASLTVVQSSTKYGTWQYNPISKLWYSLRSDKDRFSTLVQGSGAYVLDMWLYIIHQECLKQSIDFRLLGQFHDELILEVMDEVKYERIVRDSIAKLSKSLSLNRGLDCGVDFGKDYSEIH